MTELIWDTVYRGKPIVGRGEGGGGRGCMTILHDGGGGRNLQILNYIICECSLMTGVKRVIRTTRIVA